MKSFRQLAFTMALLGCATPALADVRTAAFASASDQSTPQTAMFAGATLRIALNRKHNQPPNRAVIGIGGMARNPGASGPYIGQGLGLSLDGKGKTELHMAGRDVGDLWRTANLSGGGKTALVVVGAAALVGVAALVVVDNARCEDEGNACD